MTRLTTVLKSTIFGFLFVSLFLLIILYIDSVIDGKEMPWEFLGFVNLYGMIVSIIFGYMDRPSFEKRLLIVIIISSVVMLITSFIIGNQVLRFQSLYVLIGIGMGRNIVVLIDMSLSENNHKKKRP
jgi:hypothetical protein